MSAVPHPTIALLQSSSLTSVVQQEIERRILQGDVPSPFTPPKGCPFAGRCSLVMDRCHQQMPPLDPRGDAAHRVACWAVP